MYSEIYRKGPRRCPGHLDYGKSALNPQIHVTCNTPPTFLLQAQNDDVDSVSNSLVYCMTLKNAGVPAELHLFPERGHVFGLRQSRFSDYGMASTGRNMAPVYRA